MPVTRRTGGKARRLGAAATVILALTLTGGIAPARARTGAPVQPDPGVPEVTVTVLPPLPGTAQAPLPRDINNHGQVVGASSGRAVLWDGGEPTELPQVGPGTQEGTFVNDRGDVVVTVSTLVGSGLGASVRLSAYRWFEGQVTDLAATPDGTVGVHDLNERGQIALSRSAVVSGSPVRVVGVWEDGSLTPITAPSGTSALVSDLSDDGHVVGHLQLLPQTIETLWFVDGFTWHRGTLTRLGLWPTDIRLVNRHGQAVAHWGTLPFLLDGGRVVPINLVPPGFVSSGQVVGFPRDLNDRGQVVGTVGTFGVSTDDRAVLWEDGQVTELPGLGRGPSRARQINEHGQVLGTSMADDGTHAVLWTSGHTVDLGLIGPGDHHPTDLELNDEGQVAGQRITPGGPEAVVWDVDDQ